MTVNTSALAFVPGNTFIQPSSFLSSRQSAWCPAVRFQGSQTSHKRVRRCSTNSPSITIRCDWSVSDAIERALENEFRGKDISRITKSFRNVIDGKVLENNKDGTNHQRASSFVEGLDAVPFSDDFSTDLEWVMHLEQNWVSIADELKQVTSQPDIQQKGNNIWAPPVVEAANAYGPDWRTLVLQDRGWDPVNTKLFPKTTRLLQGTVPSVEAFFARQDPNTGIKLHTDDCNFILTMHLALSTPDKKAWIEVAGERRYWENGKGLVFNTSYFHRTMNESRDEERLVLLIRFWHPQLTQYERDALSFLFGAIEAPDTNPAVLQASAEILEEENKTTKLKKGLRDAKIKPSRPSKTSGKGFGK